MVSVAPIIPVITVPADGLAPIIPVITVPADGLAPIIPVITLPADGLAPNGAKPSAGTELRTILWSFFHLPHLHVSHPGLYPPGRPPWWSVTRPACSSPGAWTLSGPRQPTCPEPPWRSAPRHRQICTDAAAHWRWPSRRKGHLPGHGSPEKESKFLFYIINIYIKSVWFICISYHQHFSIELNDEQQNIYFCTAYKAKVIWDKGICLKYTFPKI